MSPSSNRRGPLGDSVAGKGLRKSPLKLLWLVLGFICVGMGGIGVIVPGVPTTVFFICAAAFFARSSARLERWILDLPGIGPAVSDYRHGLGMPRRAKLLAVVSIAVFCGLALMVGVSNMVARAVVLLAGVVGIAFICWRVPTREKVVAARNGPGASARPSEQGESPAKPEPAAASKVTPRRSHDFIGRRDRSASGRRRHDEDCGFRRG